MLDLRLIREDKDGVQARLGARGGAVDYAIADLLLRDKARRANTHLAELAKAEHNKASKEIARQYGGGSIPKEVQADSRARSERIKKLDAEIAIAEEDIRARLLRIPNIPHESVPQGASAAENVELRQWGRPREFAFKPKLHEKIGEDLGILDFQRATKLAKSRFTVMWGLGARLERALIQFMLDLHTREHGYTELWVPHLVSAAAMEGVGQLPKFEEQLFKTVEPDDNRVLYLIPTAEVPVTYLHSGEVLAEKTLPRRYVCFTPCYRREAGTYGQDTKGMLRQHQFDKVELVKITTPEHSYNELDSMTHDAEEVLQRLELPYRVVVLSAGDMGANAAKTYDLEVWLPGQKKYREISSCSNCEAYQARRSDIRVRRAVGGKIEFCHTLNGSGLAVGRTLIAVLENYQEKDGSVVVPKALRPYMDGIDRINTTA